MTLKEKYLIVWGHPHESFGKLITFLTIRNLISEKEKSKLTKLYKTGWSNFERGELLECPSYVLFINLVYNLIKDLKDDHKR